MKKWLRLKPQGLWSPNSAHVRNSTAEFLTFAYQTGGDGVEVQIEEGTIWAKGHLLRIS